MVILFTALLIGCLLPLAMGILLARWRPNWTYLKVALLAAAPIPVTLASVAFFIFSGAWTLQGLIGTAAIVMPVFVLGVMAGAVGAWLTPRPSRPVVTKDEIESIFR